MGEDLLNLVIVAFHAVAPSVERAWNSYPTAGSVMGGAISATAVLFLLRALKRRLLRPTARVLSRDVDTSDSVRHYMLAGLATAILLVAGVGGWAATTELAGAVLAQGTIVVDSNVKKVQHQTGGIVGEIRVRDGDRVAAGDIVLRLDETIVRANLQVVRKQLDENLLRQSRLKAERDGARQLLIPEGLLARGDEPPVREIIAGEGRLFESRLTAREGQKAQLRERILQLRQEVKGIAGQLHAKSQEIHLVQAELEGQRDLWEKNLISITKFTATQREAARLYGDRSQLESATAQAKGKIAEIELQIIQIDQDLRSEVLKELRDAQAKEAELIERKVAAEDQLKRIDLRAPQDGIVHQLAVHTVGGVISASDAVMLIVPTGDPLVIEAKIAPQDIDHVRVGATCFVRLTAFNQRTTPEFTGSVLRVAADLTRDAQLNLTFYTARIRFSAEELKRMETLRLVPGMPAEVFIKTTDRTALSYLLKPLQDQFAKAFKEQ